MTAETPEAATTTSIPTIHVAELASGPTGAVLFGPELDFESAVARRKTGLDVVIRGDETGANRSIAYQIEAAVGPPSRPQPPERQAGLLALPHFHQQSRDPAGHLFYETERRKAKKHS